MQVFFIYLLKLTVSLAIVHIFYQLLLRRLTFYNHNRWYLIGYSLLCFVIPFVDISPVLESRVEWNKGFIGMVPVVDHLTGNPGSGPRSPVNSINWNWLFVIFVAGILFMVVRLMFQFISFTRMRRNAKLVSDESVKFYQVDKKIIPFSFGNSIFVNQSLHTDRELQEIIRHEFVHVKQKHSIDILLAELLCILNWYNPFAWLIRRSIRQNLEFIADRQVLDNGMDKKQYQYLLLKVMGNNHYSISNPFNFSSLKNRIVMMNKMRTARVHITRSLFIAPLFAVVLLSFRSAQVDKATFSASGELPSAENLSSLASETKPPSAIALFDQDTLKPGKKITANTPAAPAKTGEPGKNVTTEGPLKELTLSGHRAGGKPYVIVDGVDWPEGLDLNMIDPAKIESMNIWKGAEAKSKYGGKGENGVIVLTTKKSKSVQLVEQGMPENILYYIDGKSATKESVDLLEPTKIKSVNVLKGVKAEEKYGEKGKNGAVEIITTSPTQINYIEKRPLPVLDVRNVLIGKKTEEC